MRMIVPRGAGWIWRGPSVGSGSTAAIGTGAALVFQISVERWPGRSGLVFTEGASSSDSTTALPFLSWPVTTRLMNPVMCSSLKVNV